MLRKFRRHKTAIACLSILIIFLLTIIIRDVTRQLLIKKLGWNNTFTHIVMFDAPNLERGSDSHHISINWAEKYPFAENTAIQVKGISYTKKIKNYIDRARTRVNKIKSGILLYTEERLAGKEYISTFADYLESKLNLGDKPGIGDKRAPNDKTILGDRIINNIIFLDNNYLTYVESPLDDGIIQENAAAVADFRDFLRERNIPLLYVNAGSKVDPADPQMPGMLRNKENTNQRGDALLQALAQHGIDYIDMRDEMHRAGLNWYDAYYITDHHWKTETGLWAAGIIADKLNNFYGFSFDSVYFNPTSYNMETFPGIFLGNEGRQVSRNFIMPEDYTCILPRFETDFYIEIPSKGVTLDGAYKDTLYDYEHLQTCLKYNDRDFFNKPDPYYSIRWRNDPVGIIKNHLVTNNQGKKILMIQDSFAWYLTTYLACDISEINMLHFGFEGSIRAYVKEYKPDMVIILYCEKNISKTNWNKHDSAFDFR